LLQGQFCGERRGPKVVVEDYLETKDLIEDRDISMFSIIQKDTDIG
jgi:hypothetical protein